MEYSPELMVEIHQKQIQDFQLVVFLAECGLALQQPQVQVSIEGGAKSTLSVQDVSEGSPA